MRAGIAERRLRFDKEGRHVRMHFAHRGFERFHDPFDIQNIEAILEFNAQGR